MLSVLGYSEFEFSTLFIWPNGSAEFLKDYTYSIKLSTKVIFQKYNIQDLCSQSLSIVSLHTVCLIFSCGNVLSNSNSFIVSQRCFYHISLIPSRYS